MATLATRLARRCRSCRSVGRAASSKAPGRAAAGAAAGTGGGAASGTEATGSCSQAGSEDCSTAGSACIAGEVAATPVTARGPWDCGFSAKETKFEIADSPAASAAADVWARSMAGRALLGLADEHAEIKSAKAFSSSSMVLCNGARFSRKARETASSKACSGDRGRSLKTVPTPSAIMETAARRCQLTFRAAFRNKQRWRWRRARRVGQVLLALAGGGSYLRASGLRGVVLDGNRRVVRGGE